MILISLIHLLNIGIYKGFFYNQLSVGFSHQCTSNRHNMAFESIWDIYVAFYVPQLIYQAQVEEQRARLRCRTIWHNIASPKQDRQMALSASWEINTNLLLQDHQLIMHFEMRKWYHGCLPIESYHKCHKTEYAPQESQHHLQLNITAIQDQKTPSSTSKRYRASKILIIIHHQRKWVQIQD